MGYQVTDLLWLSSETPKRNLSRYYCNSYFSSQEKTILVWVSTEKNIKKRDQNVRELTRATIQFIKLQGQPGY